MRVGDYVADFYAAAAAVQGRVEDPRAVRERVRDCGHHGDAGCVAGADDVCGEDVEYEGGF